MKYLKRGVEQKRGEKTDFKKRGQAVKGWLPRKAVAGTPLRTMYSE